MHPFSVKTTEFLEEVKVALEGNSVGISRTRVSMFFICDNLLYCAVGIGFILMNGAQKTFHKILV